MPEADRRFASPGSPAARPRYAVLAVALILSAFVAWRIARSVLASDVPISVAGLLDDPGSADPATRDPAAAPTAAAVVRARAALGAEPLAADAYVVLALAAGHAGRDAQAVRLMRIAAAWWPRGLRAQTWLLAHALLRSDYPAAVARLDALARGRPDTLDDLTGALAPVLTDPAAVAALADRLGADPPWRTRFITIAVRQWREPDGIIALLGLLQGRPPGLGAAELRPYLDKLMATGRVDRAYFVWLQSLPAERRADLGFLYNGHFRYPVSDVPFDWRLPPVPGATVSVANGAADRIVTVGFLGGRVPLAPVLHDLVLAPGSYRLSGRARTDRLRSERGAVWRIACREDADGALARSEPFAASAPWHDFAVDFTVPDTGCRAQILALEIHARVAAEQTASGIVSFSALAIAPR